MTPEDSGALEALVLAGGAGSRLGALAADRPKALVEVAGRPMIAWALEPVRAAGIRRAILCVGRMAEQVEAALGESFAGGMRLEYSREPRPLGTAGALRLALGRLAAPAVLVANADSRADADLARFAEWRRRSGFPAAVLAARAADASRFGMLEVDPASGALAALREKRGVREPALVNAGVYILPRRLLAGIPAGRAVSLEREMLPAWAARGEAGVWPGASGFVDIGTPEGLASAAGKILRMRRILP